jgi:hypothetical protein
MRRLLVVAGAIVAVGAAASARGDDGPMTVERAKAVAKAINLTAADLPAYSGLPHASTADSRRAQAQALDCARVTPRREAVATVNSRDFERERVIARDRVVGTVTSTVSVMRTTSIATRDLAALGNERARRCYAKYGAGSDPHVVKVTASRLRAPIRHAAGIRLKVEVSVNRQRQTLFVDSFAFRRGPAEVQLTAGEAIHPFPATEERRLLLALLERAQRALSNA